MKIFLCTILAIASLFTSSLQQTISKESLIEKFSQESDVDVQFKLSQEQFGKHHLDSIKQISETYFKAKSYDDALVYVNVLSNFYIYKTIQHEEAFENLEHFKSYLEQCKNAKEIAKFYVAYAESATYLEQLEKAMTLAKEGINYLETVKDSSLYEFGYLYLKSAENLSKLNKVSESAEHFEKASKIFRHQKDTLFYLWSQNGLATLLGNNGLYDEAANTRKVIYELGPKIGEEQVVAMAHLQAALDANFSEKHNELFHYRNALTLKNEASDIQNIITILALSYASEAYARAQKIDTARLYLKQLDEKMAGKTFNSQLKTNYDFARAHIALSENRIEDAETISLDLLKHIKNSKDAGLSIRINSLLSTIYERKGNTKKSLDYFKAYSRINDSLKTASTRNRFAYVQTQFETEKKDLEIEKQQKDIVLLDAESKVKSQWLLFGGLGLLAIFGFFYILKSRNHSAEKARRQEQFSQELIQAQEDERTRVARDLHDSVGQKLMLLTRQTKTKNDPQMEALAGSTLEELRSISRGLHPSTLERLGVTSAIKSLVNEVDANSDIFVTAEVDNIDNQLSKEASLHLYRIIQEALSNVLKHSQAKATSVSIKNETKGITVEISDNGKGFLVNQKQDSVQSLGMKTLIERARILGTELIIKSTPNKGTTLSLNIPT